MAIFGLVQFEQDNWSDSRRFINIENCDKHAVVSLRMASRAGELLQEKEDRRRLKGRGHWIMYRILLETN